jgi:hypothetical protein
LVRRLSCFPFCFILSHFVSFRCFCVIPLCKGKM